MSQEQVQPVRQRLSARGRSARTRTFEERLAVRFPWMAQGWSRLIVRLSPTSRLRRALMLRAIQSGFAAYNRGDLDVCVLLYHPDVKFERSEDHSAVGLSVRFQGLAGYREFAAEWTGGWGEHRFEPRELFDLGDRFLVLTKLTASGQGSGISLTQNHAMLSTFDKNGRVIRQQDFLDYAEALAAAGLRESGLSEGEAGIVRKPLRVRPRSTRTVEQRLFLRFPRLADACLRSLARLPPGSRLRQAVMWRGVQQSVEAFNRRDLDALSPFRDPDFELDPPHEVVEAGLMESSYRGDAGYRRYVSEVLGVWGDDMRAEPLELIDLGDRFVVLYNMPVRARASGVPLIGEMATIAVLNNGKAIRQHDYLAHAEALQAVGLQK